MDKSLDDVFSNIQQSEQESNAQHEYLNKLKSRISATEREAKDAETKYREMEEEIQKKMKRLANREVMLLSLNVRQKGLEERMKELKSENKDLKRTMEDLKIRLKSSREKLCKQSIQFIEEHNFFNKKSPSKPQGFSYQIPLVERNKKEITEKNHSNTVPNLCDNYNNLPKQRQEINDETELLLFDIDFNKQDFSWI